MAFNANPYYLLDLALYSGNSATHVALGDSTDYGAVDENWYGNYGWPGRVALARGAKYDVHVDVYVFNMWVGNGASTSGSLTGPATYSSPVRIRTSTKPGAQVLKVYLGGIPGGTVSMMNSNLANLIPVTNPELITVWNGFNETSVSGFVSGTSAFIGGSRSRCANTPIIVFTQHTPPNGVDSVSGHFGVTFSGLFNALAPSLISGASLPLSPVLQPTIFDGVWLQDTRQITLLTSDIYNGASFIHPNAAGYGKIAAAIYATTPASFPPLTPDTVATKWVRLGGAWYPVKARTHVSGSFMKSPIRS